jgi:hypothetical protein
MNRSVVLGLIAVLVLVGAAAHGDDVDPEASAPGTNEAPPGDAAGGTEADADNDSDSAEDEEPQSVKSLFAQSAYTRPEVGRKGQLNRFRFETEETTFSFGGAIWINYSNQAWKSPDQGKKRGLNFDNLRLAFDGRYGDHMLFSAQFRIYSYTEALHHAWFGYRWNDTDEIHLGITQVPFGLQPFHSHSFWFGLGYYVGMEDDYDAGVKWRRDAGAWDYNLAFFINEEYNDATNLDRYSVDIVRVGDQQNEEKNQFNARVAYTFGKGTSSSSEFGLSGEWGQLDNLITTRTGDRWQAAAHYNGRYGGWNPEFQIARYEYEPENPDGVDYRLVLMGNLGSTRLVAAKGTLINLNVRKFWDVSWGPFRKFNAYVNYSHLFKDEDSFKDSQLFDPGCVFQAGPIWIWVDFLFGKNAWYLNDSPEMSGMGPGGTDDWEYRFNVNFEWYF